MPAHYFYFDLLVAFLDCR
ncbi:hypothetical protein EQH50_06255 [Klebsiella quasipneumoniae]|nr:hypothetical protein EQH50_06255 [Klebsiella quasipneumoniae]